MSVYLLTCRAPCHNTSNALNALVSQKTNVIRGHLKLSMPLSGSFLQTVWARVPEHRASHWKSPAVVNAESEA